MMTKSSLLGIWRRISPEAKPATFRVRGNTPGGSGWTFTDYALTHVHRGPLQRYTGAGEPQATADTTTIQVWADDLSAVSAPVPRRHDVIVQDGVSYVIESVQNALMDAVYLCEVVKVGPGGVV